MSYNINNDFSSAGKSAYHQMGADFSRGFFEEFDLFKLLQPSPNTNYEEVTKNIKKLGETMSAAYSDVFSSVGQDFSIKVLPWVSLGIGTMVGVPYLVSYVYYRFKHYIGRPKLAMEVGHVNPFMKAYQGAHEIASTTFRSISPAFNVYISTILSGVFFKNAILACKITKAFEEYPMFSDAINYLDKSDIQYYVASTAKFLFYSIFAYNLGFSLYNKFSNRPLQDKPIFNKKLSSEIETICETTKNIRKNGGILQDILFLGPAGTGKTMISNYIARNANMNFVMMSGGDLAQFIKRGEHVSELNQLFENAKNSLAPTVIFIDEAESLCRNRSKIERAESLELINAFLKHTGEPSKKVMIILATNKPEDLDPAVLNRMDYKLYIGPPEAAERKKILEMYISKFFSKEEQSEFFNEKTLNTIVQKTKGFTGRTIFKMVNAIKGHKHMTKDNTITKEMIISTVNQFVAQEKLFGNRNANRSYFHKILGL